MPSQTKTAKSLSLICPKCGEGGDARIDLNLNDLDEITCGSCSETFTATEAAQTFAERAMAWQRVVRMIEAACE